MINSDEDIKNIDLKEYLNYIKMVSEEMENYTQQLNEVYSAKQEIFKTGEAIWYLWSPWCIWLLTNL